MYKKRGTGWSTHYRTNEKKSKNLSKCTWWYWLKRQEFQREGNWTWLPKDCSLTRSVDSRSWRDCCCSSCPTLRICQSTWPAPRQLKHTHALKSIKPGQCKISHGKKSSRKKNIQRTHICNYLELAGPAGDQSRASCPRWWVRQRRGRPPTPTVAPNSLGLRAGTPCSTTPHLPSKWEKWVSRAPDFCTLGATTHWQDWCRGRRPGWQRRWGCPALRRRWRTSSAACRRLPSFAKVADPACRTRPACEPSGCRTRLIDWRRTASALKV